jgi:AraC family transcriptional regulator, regulatory protein of adaptative response / methylated-DNA-[protein]-cysteine methyltransferase
MADYFKGLEGRTMSQNEIDDFSKKYATAVEAQRFRDELSSSSSITSAIYSAGFGSSSRVYEKENNLLAMSPSQFRNYGSGIKMRMQIFPCSLGFVLIAFTDLGVSSVELRDDEENLNSAFKLRFRNANIKKLTFNDKRIVETILLKVEDPKIKVDIPLDIHGTIFQKETTKK